jgi:hypothetical protein
MSHVERVVASATLRSIELQRGDLEAIKRARGDSSSAERVIAALTDRLEQDNHIEVDVALAAELSDGRRVECGPTIRIGGPRRGLAAIRHRYRGPRLSDDPAEEADLMERSYRVGRTDIEDGIDQLLGRNAEMHRPPRLAWDPLITALSAADVTIGEDELIGLPMIVVFDDALAAELAPPA